MDDKINSKQPDELFKGKLQDYEVPVNPDVWDRLTRETTTPSRSLGWNRRSMTAAVVTGLMLAGGIWMTVQHANDGQEQVVLPSNEIRTLTAPLAEKAVEQSSSRENNKDLADSPATSILTSRPDDKTQDALPGRSPNGKEAQAIDPPASPIELASAEDPTKADEISNKAGESEESPGSELPVVAGEKDAPSKPAEIVNQTRVLVVYVTPPSHLKEVDTTYDHYEEETVLAQFDRKDEKKEKKGLNRLFRQLKNVKTGEGIDWEELGFNPQRRFANADYRVVE